MYSSHLVNWTLRSFYIVAFVSLAFLVSVPFPISIPIALLTLWSILFLVKTRGDAIGLDAYGKLFVVIISAYLVSKIVPFINSGYVGRYLSPGVHMFVVLPILLVLWKFTKNLSESIERGKTLSLVLTVASAVGSFSGLLLAIYQTQVLGFDQADGFLYSISFGYLTGSLFAISLGLVGTNRLSVLSILSCVAALGAVILSGSRGALFPLAFVFVAWLLFSFKYVPKRYLLLITIVAITLPVLAYKTLPVLQSRVDIGVSELRQIAKGDVHHSSSMIVRVQLWITAIYAYNEAPFFGLTYPEREQLNVTLVEEGKVVPWMLTVKRGHAHSQYFETLATGGLVGIVCLFFYLFAPLLVYFRFLLANAKNVFARVGALFTLAVCGFGLTEVMLQKEMIAVYYGFMQVIFLVFSYRRWQVDQLAKAT